MDTIQNITNPLNRKTVTLTAAIAAIENNMGMLNDLDNKIVTPRSIVGGGYKDGRKVARAYLVNIIRTWQEAIQAVHPEIVFYNLTNSEMRKAALVTYGPTHEKTAKVNVRYAA